MTSDPQRSVRDVPTVRGHLSFLNIHFRVRAGVSLGFKILVHSLVLFVFLPPVLTSNTSKLSSFWKGPLVYISYCFSTSVLFQPASVFSLYPFHHVEILTYFWENFHTSLTSLQLVSNESQHMHTRNIISKLTEEFSIPLVIFVHKEPVHVTWRS